MPRAIIVHGYASGPRDAWLPWLEKELTTRGFLVHALEMPTPHEPRVSEWVETLTRAVEAPDEHTYFIGHSLGCQAILRFLETLSGRATVGGAVFVAGFLRPLEGVTKLTRPTRVPMEWVENLPDSQLVRNVLGRSVAIFSDDDRTVPLEYAKAFEEELGSEVRIEHGKRHFHSKAGIFTLPSALEAILEISGRG